MSKDGYTFLLVATCLATAGCGSSWFSDRETNPVIEEYQATGWGGSERLVGILATTASRRTVLVNLSERDPGRIGFVCAEPPPDVSEAFAKSFAAELSAQGIPAGGAGTVSGDVNLASTMATAVGALLYRTQSLQFLRDQTYILCLDYFNGIIKSDAQYLATEKQHILSVESAIRVMVVVGERVGRHRGGVEDRWGGAALEVAGRGARPGHTAPAVVTRRGRRPRRRRITA